MLLAEVIVEEKDVTEEGFETSFEDVIYVWAALFVFACILERGVDKTYFWGLYSCRLSGEVVRKAELVVVETPGKGR